MGHISGSVARTLVGAAPTSIVPAVDAPRPPVRLLLVDATATAGKIGGPLAALCEILPSSPRTCWKSTPVLANERRHRAPTSSTWPPRCDIVITGATPLLYAHVDGLAGLRRDLAHRANIRLVERLSTASEPHSDPSRRPTRRRPCLPLVRSRPPRSICGPLARSPPRCRSGRSSSSPNGQCGGGRAAGLGIGPERHVDVIRALRALLHGFVDLELAGGFGLADPVDGSFAAALDLLFDALESRYRPPAA